MFREFLDLLRPPHPLDGGPDADPAYRARLYQVRLRGWNWRVNHTVLSIVGFCGLLAIALSPSGLPLLGPIAWANGTDQKIQAAISPIQIKMDKIEEQTRQIKDHQDAKELSDVRQKLFETRVAQCKARSKGAAIDNPYSERMRELQDLHFNLTHTYYVPSDCADL